MAYTYYNIIGEWRFPRDRKQRYIGFFVEEEEWMGVGDKWNSILSGNENIVAFSK